MTFYQQNIDFGIGRHKDAVRVGERRALRRARVEPQVEAGGRLVRKAAEWLGRQRASLGREFLPNAVPAHGEQASG